MSSANKDSDRDFKGIWIDRDLYFNEDLSWTEKILIIEIDSLDNPKNRRENGDEKACFASNKHLADFIGLTEASTKNLITKLKKSGWIFQLWSDGRQRGLRSKLYDNRGHKKVTPASQKNDSRGHKNMLSQKNDHSNTVKDLNVLDTQLEKTHTHSSPAPATPRETENGVCVNPQNISNPKPADGHLSKFTIPECRQYIAFCDSRDGNIKNIKLVAEKIYKDGLSDGDMKEYFDSLKSPPEVKKEIVAQKANCPRCFGGGMEFAFNEKGETLGIKSKCKHQPLIQGEPLFEKRAREDLDDAAL